MSLNPRPLKIDEESIVDHFYLKKGDKCFYFGEYTAGAGWKFSETNSLISNFKKGISKMGTPEWKYRNKAIGKIGRLIAPLMKHGKSNSIWVPTPPSKIKTDPNYDSRIEDALNFAKKISRTNTNICNCVTQKENREAYSYTSEQRLEPEQMAENYSVNPNMIPVNTKRAIIVDDVLTTGSHFKGMEISIQRIFPNIEVIGLFVARTVRLPPFEQF